MNVTSIFKILRNKVKWSLLGQRKKMIYFDLKSYRFKRKNNQCSLKTVYLMEL